MTAWLIRNNRILFRFIAKLEAADDDFCIENHQVYLGLFTGRPGQPKPLFLAVLFGIRRREL